MMIANDQILLFFAIVILLLMYNAVMTVRRKNKFKRLHKKFTVQRFCFEIDKHDALLANKITTIFLDTLSAFAGIDSDYFSPDMTINDLLKNKLISDDGDREDIALDMSKKIECELRIFESFSGKQSFKSIILALIKESKKIYT